MEKIAELAFKKPIYTTNTFHTRSESFDSFSAPPYSQSSKHNPSPWLSPNNKSDMPSTPEAPNTSSNPRPATPPSAVKSQSQTQSHPAPSPARSPLAKRAKPSTTATSSLEEPNTTQSSTPAFEPPHTTASTAMAPTSAPPATTRLEDAPPLLIKKLVPNAQAPKRGSAFAAGYDLYAAASTSIPARGKGLVSTGLAMAVPAGTCMYRHSLSPFPSH
jgi:hypothetical protein